MNFEIKDIEDFLNGTLSKDKELLFKEKMQTDQAFAKEVTDFREIFSGFNVLKDEHKAKQLILDWENDDDAKLFNLSEEKKTEQQSNNVPVRKIRSFRTVSIAASILLLIAAFYWTGIRPHSNRVVYANFYNDKNTSTAIKSGGTSTHPFKVGYDAYDKGNYEEAIAFFSAIPISDPNHNTSLYYLSHSNLQLENWVDAITAIEFLKSKNDIRYQEEAEWLAVLCFLRLKDKDNLSSSLSAILDNSNHAYYNKALELDSELDSFLRKTFF